MNANCFLNGGLCEATYGPSNTRYTVAGMQQAVTVMRQAGYTGPIHCTAGTAELATLVLLDSGKLHEEFAKRNARWERRHPDLIVSDMNKQRRRGKVLIDWSQNDEHKTTVCVYSLRARETPTVSTPVEWDEVEAVLRSRDPDDLSFTSDEVLERVGEHGDPFSPVLELEQELPG